MTPTLSFEDVTSFSYLISYNIREFSSLLKRIFIHFTITINHVRCYCCRWLFIIPNSLFVLPPVLVLISNLFQVLLFGCLPFHQSKTLFCAPSPLFISELLLVLYFIHQLLFVDLLPTISHMLQIEYYLWISFTNLRCLDDTSSCMIC